MSRNRARRLVPAAFLGALLLTAVLAGCKSTPTSAAPPAAKTTAGKTPATNTTTPASTGGGTGKLSGPPASCPDAAVVMSSLSLSSLTVQSGDPSLCEYLHNGDKSQPYVAITFNSAPGMTAAAVRSGLVEQQTNVQDVSGVGDAAFSFAQPDSTGAQGAGLTFLSGGTICSIITTVPSTTAAEVTLAKAILGG